MKSQGIWIWILSGNSVIVYAGIRRTSVVFQHFQTTSPLKLTDSSHRLVMGKEEIEKISVSMGIFGKKFTEMFIE